jgi:DNA polymerase-3 subunit alpha
VGEGPVEAIVRARQEGGAFRDLFDFCERVGAGKLNKRVLEALVRCGALDSVGPSRAVLWDAIPAALKAADQSARNEDAGMMDLFGAVEAEAPSDPYAEFHKARDWTDKERLQGEKDTLGLYVTGHPIDEYEAELKHLVSRKLVEIQPDRGRSQKMAGLVVDMRLKKTKKGDNLCFLTLDDRSARLEVTLFGDTYEEARTVINKDAVLVVEGEVVQDDYNGGLKVRCNRVQSMAQIRAAQARCVEVQCDTRQLGPRQLRQLADTLAKGRSPLISLSVALRYRREDAEARVWLGSEWSVSPTDELLLQLKEQFGNKAVRLCYD